MSATRARAIMDLVADAAGRRPRMVAGSHGARSLMDLVTDGGGVSGRGGQSWKKNVAEMHDGD